MKFNYKIVTGDSSITGSYSDFAFRNREGFVNLNYPRSFSSSKFRFYDSSGNIKYDPIVFNASVITGSHCSLVSINSQTLLEETPTIDYGNNVDVYSINTGDFFIKNDFDYSLGYLNIDQVKESDIVVYNHREFSTGIAVQKTDSVSMNTAVASLYNAVDSIYSDLESPSDLFNLYDVFLNGQKIQDGECPADSVTGKLFAIKKGQNEVEISTDVADLYGTGFVETQVDFYANGMEQRELDFIELYTGVTMVETGIQASFKIFNQTTEEYSI